MNKFRTRLSLSLLLPLLMVVAGCEATKSSTPLSPSVAGPIPGVDITAPKTLEPNSGSTLAVDQQPITLLIENASSTSPRPLNYTFEVAVDADFTNKLFARDGVAPGDGGRTSLRLPEALASGRTYYWRSRAQDGANTGPYSGSTYFSIRTPIVIDKPIPASPVNNVTIEGLAPTFVITNAPRSGPIGGITYTLELSDTDSFANKIAIWTISEQPNQTTLVSPQGLSYSKQYFWHSRATDRDSNTSGPWSDTQVFQTPAPPPPPPPPPPTGGGGGGGGGNWENCGSTPGDKLVACVHASVNPSHTPEGAFEVTKRVAWLLRGQGVGLLIKNGGENIVAWKGRSFAAARICYPDGHIYKILSDVPATNGPTWQDNDFVSPSLYVPAIDPR